MPTKSKAAKKKTVKFYVDCWQPVEDSVLDVATFEKFLRDTIKVDNKAGNLGDKVVLSTEKTKVVVQATDGVIAKRYLKYLTKKYLKKQLRDYAASSRRPKTRTRCATSASTPRATTRRKNCYRSEFRAPQAHVGNFDVRRRREDIQSRVDDVARFQSVGRRIHQIGRRFPFFAA